MQVEIRNIYRFPINIYELLFIGKLNISGLYITGILQVVTVYYRYVCMLPYITHILQVVTHKYMGYYL